MKKKDRTLVYVTYGVIALIVIVLFTQCAVNQQTGDDGNGVGGGVINNFFYSVSNPTNPQQQGGQQQSATTQALATTTQAGATTTQATATTTTTQCVGMLCWLIPVPIVTTTTTLYIPNFPITTTTMLIVPTTAYVPYWIPSTTTTTTQPFDMSDPCVGMWCWFGDLFSGFTEPTATTIPQITPMTYPSTPATTYGDYYGIPTTTSTTSTTIFYPAYGDCDAIRGGCRDSSGNHYDYCSTNDFWFEYDCNKATCVGHATYCPSLGRGYTCSAGLGCVVIG